MGLLERLGDLQRFDALAPGEDLFQRAADRVPEAHLGVAGRADGVALEALQAVLAEHHGVLLAAFADHPDQPPRQGADQRMVKVALLPLAERPVLFQQEQAVQALGLGREHGADVLDRTLQLLELLLVVSLDLGRHRFLRRAVGAEPAQAGALAVDFEFGDKGAVIETFAAQADLFQAVGRHAELFDLVTRQLQGFGGAGEGLFDFLLRGTELDPHLEQGQLPDGFAAGDRRQGEYRCVADLGRSRADAAHLAVGAQREAGDGPGQFAVGQRRAHP
ncbi:hypothetical protein D3C85_1047870 [compost metagenome]